MEQGSVTHGLCASVVPLEVALNDLYLVIRDRLGPIEDEPLDVLIAGRVGNGSVIEPLIAC